MNRPASLAGSLPSPASLRGFLKGLIPSRRARAKAGLIGVALAVLVGVVLIYSPVAHPRDLQVDGVTGSDAATIREAIESTARGQSTFAVSESALMRSVGNYPQVAAIKIHAHPPFRLDLDVEMRPPVATMVIGGRSFVVAADGTVLGGIASANVPKIDGSIEGIQIREASMTGARGSLRILGAAPEPLLGLARSIRAGGAGLEVVMQRGPRLIFGNSDDAADKWSAAAAVLADGPAVRASYIDVRVPSRPAVGGLGGSHAAGYTDAPPVLGANTATAAAAATSAAATQATPQQTAASQTAATLAQAQTQQTQIQHTQVTPSASGTGPASGAGVGTPSGAATSSSATTSGASASQIAAAASPAAHSAGTTADTASGAASSAAQSPPSSSGGESLAGPATP